MDLQKVDTEFGELSFDQVSLLTMTPDEYESALADGRVSYDDSVAPVLDISDEPIMRAFGLGDWLCKIWRAVLKLVDSIVETVTDIVATVGKAVVRLLTDVVEIIADGVDGLLSSPGGKLLLIAGAGLGIWWLMGRRKDKDPETTQVYT